MVTLGSILLIVPTIFSQAQNPEVLNRQLQELFNQVSALQAKLNATTDQAPAPTVGALICTFTRDLFSGARGEDVRCLQKYLNESGFPLAVSGPGSKGNETNHFGELTRRAVAKWQRTFGLSPDVGYFGPLSRKKYSEFNSGLTGQANSNLVRIDSITPTSGSPGTRVLIRGSGFTSEGNNLNFDSVDNLVSDLGSSNNAIIFEIPASLCRQNAPCLTPDLSTGRHLVSISNSNGRSNDFEFQVTVAPITASEIIPAEGKPGTIVTIKGFGFTPTGNAISIGDALIKHETVFNVSSPDGQTLQFTFNPPPPHPEDFEGIESMDQFNEVLDMAGMTFSQFEANYTDDYQIRVTNSKGEQSTDLIFFRGRGQLPF